MKKLSHPQRAAVAFAGLAIAVVPALAACGSSSSSDSSPSASPTSADPTQSASSSTAGGKPVLSNGTAPAERIMSVGKAGFAPSELTIQKGQNVTFKADGPGVYSVLVGGLDGVTVTGGLIETYTFPEAGVYDVKEDISASTARITVQ